MKTIESNNNAITTITPHDNNNNNNNNNNNSTRTRGRHGVSCESRLGRGVQQAALDTTVVLLRKHALHQSRQGHIKGGPATIPLTRIETKKKKAAQKNTRAVSWPSPTLEVIDCCGYLRTEG